MEIMNRIAVFKITAVLWTQFNDRILSKYLFRRKMNFYEWLKEWIIARLNNCKVILYHSTVQSLHYI